MSKNKQPKIKVYKNRFNSQALQLEAGTSYALGEDENSDIRLKGVNASLFMENEKWILMSLTPNALRVNDEVMSSVALRRNLHIQLGEYRLEYNLAEDKKQQNTADKPDRERLYLYGGALIFLIFYFAFLKLIQKDPSEVDNQVQQRSSEVSEQAEVSDYDNVNKIVTDPSAKAMNPAAHRLFNTATNLYDQGNLHKALQTMLKAAEIDPQSRLINLKISDWEAKLDQELTRYYRQACFDLRFLRYYEARQMFEILQELSYDKKDIRFIESQRILTALEAERYDGLTCGTGQ